jgi:hypothetical protein
MVEAFPIREQKQHIGWDDDKRKAECQALPSWGTGKRNLFSTPIIFIFNDPKKQNPRNLKHAQQHTTNSFQYTWHGALLKM